MKNLKNVIGQDEAEILKMEKEINGSTTLTIDPERSRRDNFVGPGKAYLLKKKKEQAIKDMLSKRINEYGQRCFEILKGLSCEARINKLLPREVTERKDDMVLNSAFLVDKKKVCEFIHTTDGFKTQYNGKGFNFVCTGPWPPYNFC